MNIIKRLLMGCVICATLSACSTLHTLQAENTAVSGNLWIAKDTGIPLVLPLMSEIFFCKTSSDGTPASCEKADMRLLD
jgi:hypothetical protein